MWTRSLSGRIFILISIRPVSCKRGLRAKWDSLTRLQNIQRKQDELTRQKEELEHLEEQERLQGELNAAEAIHKILQEDISVSYQSEEEKVIPLEDPLPLQDNIEAITLSAEYLVAATSSLTLPSSNRRIPS